MFEESQKIQDYLEISCSNEPEEIKQRISDLQVFLARSGNMLAEAKKELRKKKTKSSK